MKVDESIWWNSLLSFPTPSHSPSLPRALCMVQESGLLVPPPGPGPLPNLKYGMGPNQSNALPWIAVACLTLHCIASPYLALPCIALPCLALPCLAFACIALQCLAHDHIHRGGMGVRGPGEREGERGLNPIPYVKPYRGV